jgi:hypothetical protein
VQILYVVVVAYFAVSISIEDLRIHKIRNRKLIYLSSSLMIFSVLLPGARVDLITGFFFFTIFSFLFFLSREVERGVDLIAAAPGRLVDFIERGKVKLGEGKKEEKKETNKNK